MNMREKIARAMHEADLPIQEGWTSWEENLPSEHEAYLRRADAALDALMEPTKAPSIGTYVASHVPWALALLAAHKAQPQSTDAP